MLYSQCGSLFAAADQLPDDQLREQEVKRCSEAAERLIRSLERVEIHYVDIVKWDPPRVAVSREDCTVRFYDGQMRFSVNPFFDGNDKQSQGTNEVSYDGQKLYFGFNGADRHVQKFLGERGDTAPVTWEFGCRTCQYLKALGLDWPVRVAQWATVKGNVLTSTFSVDMREGEIIEFAMGNDRDPLLKISLSIPDPTVKIARQLDLDAFAKRNQVKGRKPIPGFELDSEQLDKQIEMIKAIRESNRRQRIVFWFDPRMDYALIRQLESTLDGQRIVETEASAFEQYGESRIWLPTKCTYKVYIDDMTWISGFRPAPCRVDAISLESIAFERPKDEAFALDYGPGARVDDYSTLLGRSKPDGYLTYYSPAPLENLRNITNDERHKKSSSTRWVLVIVNAILVVTLIGGFVWRKYSRR